MMRTTLTLDDDVAAALESRRRELDHTLRQEVNDLLRTGLAQAEREANESTRARPFHVEPFETGGLLIPIDDVTEALEAVEGLSPK